MTSSTASDPTLVRARHAGAFCLERQNLRRTLRIAGIVGFVLTAINQGAVIAAGDQTTATWIRCGLNFVVPFIVSNAGLLAGRTNRSGTASTAARCASRCPTTSTEISIPPRRLP